MALTAEQLDELERKARAATPGTWTVGYGDITTDRGHYIQRIGSANARRDLDHIAANSPDVTLQLVAIARAALAWGEARRSISYDAPFQRGEAERALAAALRGSP